MHDKEREEREEEGGGRKRGSERDSEMDVDFI